MEGALRADTADRPGGLPWYRLPNESFMDLEAYPFVPKANRVRRLPQREWQAIKAEIHRECEYTCHYCGRQMAPTDFLICDHLVPLARGGDNSEENLVTACDPCNTAKGMLTEAEFHEKRNAWRS